MMASNTTHPPSCAFSGGFKGKNQELIYFHHHVHYTLKLTATAVAKKWRSLAALAEHVQERGLSRNCPKARRQFAGASFAATERRNGCGA
jgi:hypothetical protein